MGNRMKIKRKTKKSGDVGKADRIEESELVRRRVAMSIAMSPDLAVPKPRKAGK